MQIKIDGAEFVRGLTLVASVAEKKNAQPILACVLIEANANGIQLSATDLELGLTCKVKGEVEKQGKLVLAVKSLLEIVRSLPRQTEITIKSLPNCWAEMAAGKSEFKLMGLSPDDFNVLPAHDEKKMFAVDGLKLCSILKHVSYAMSTDETRANLCGCLLEHLDGATLRAVATDGHRLSLCDAEVVLAKKIAFESCVIPAKGVSALVKLLDSGEENVKLGRDGNNLIVASDGVVLSMRLVDGQYPAYDAVLPKKSAHTIRLNAKVFGDALRRVGLVAADKTRGIALEFSEGQVAVTAEDPNAGAGRETLACDFHGKDFKVGFNCQYLAEAVGMLGVDEVDLGLGSELDPGMIRAAGREDLVACVMPLRL